MKSISESKETLFLSCLEATQDAMVHQFRRKNATKNQKSETKFLWNFFKESLGKKDIKNRKNKKRN